jgi:hypothetical protein
MSVPGLVFRKAGLGRGRGFGLGGSLDRAAGFDEFREHLCDALENRLVVVGNGRHDQIQLSTHVEHGGAFGSGFVSTAIGSLDPGFFNPFAAGLPTWKSRAGFPGLEPAPGL